MTDAEVAAQRGRVEALLERWTPLLGLRWWHRLNFVYARSSDEMLEGHEHSSATATVLWAYLDATVTWNLPVVADVPDDELEHIVVHELMHLFLAPLRREDEAGHTLEEFVATRLAQAFVWTRQGSQPQEAS